MAAELGSEVVEPGDGGAQAVAQGRVEGRRDGRVLPRLVGQDAGQDAVRQSALDVVVDHPGERVEAGELAHGPLPDNRPSRNAASV